MEDAAGQPINRCALLILNRTAAGDDRGVALKWLPDGKSLIALCADGTSVVVKACDVTVVDRSFYHPRFPVILASDPDGQAGIVTGAATALDLLQINHVENNGKETRRGVSPAAVQRATELCLWATYVVSGNWLGWVAEVCVDVDVLFEDGAVCRVTDAGRKLRTLDKGYGNDGVFYPGQQVAPSHGSDVFEASRWLEGYWNPGRSEEGTVAKSKVSGVLVYSIAWRETGTDRPLAQASATPKAYHHDCRNLTFLFSGDVDKFWVVSNRCSFQDEPTAATEEDHKSTVSAASNSGTLRTRLERSMCIVTNTYTAVDVVWQDGTRQHGVPSASLIPFVSCNRHERIPGQRVLRKNAANSEDSSNTTEPAECVGIVRSFNHKDVTARVSWFNHKDKQVGCDETLSAYDLYLSPDHEFHYGDIVVRLRPTTGGSSSSVREDYCSQGGRSSTEEPAQRNKKKEDLSWVGYIVDLCDAPYIQVKWGDGNMSKVLLHEIDIVKARSIKDMLHKMNDRISNNVVAPIGNNEDGDNDSASHSNGEVSPAPATTMGWTGLVIQAMVRLVGNVLAKSKRYIVSGPIVEAIENTVTHLSSRSGVGHTAHTEEPGAATAPESGIGGDGCAEQGKTKADATVSDELFHFPHFDVVQSPPDHHYLDSMKQATGSGRKWIKRVQKEWKILAEDNLPETIYMRAFEDRMDLFRAVMVGASGTPYHDGLFFFDLQLPPSYPAVPPLVSYRSFGLRLNPNLYESGTVCLSLLDTFDGDGAELWSTESSTVLQVLVSIQGLVLTALPYYNETGFVAYAGKPDGRRNELPYSESTYLLSLQTMLHLLRRPPAGFEDFVRDHFRRRGPHVLHACKAYLDGCTVGTLDCEARPTKLSKERSSSAGFRLALANIVPRLAQVFKEIGADIQ